MEFMDVVVAATEQENFFHKLSKCGMKSDKIGFPTTTNLSVLSVRTVMNLKWQEAVHEWMSEATRVRVISVAVKSTIISRRIQEEQEKMCMHPSMHPWKHSLSVWHTSQRVRIRGHICVCVCL